MNSKKGISLKTKLFGLFPVIVTTFLTAFHTEAGEMASFVDRTFRPWGQPISPRPTRSRAGYGYESSNKLFFIANSRNFIDVQACQEDVLNSCGSKLGNVQLPTSGSCRKFKKNDDISSTFFLNETRNKVFVISVVNTSGYRCNVTTSEFELPKNEKIEDLLVAFEGYFLIRSHTGKLFLVDLWFDIKEDPTNGAKVSNRLRIRQLDTGIKNSEGVAPYFYTNGWHNNGDILFFGKNIPAKGMMSAYKLSYPNPEPTVEKLNGCWKKEDLRAKMDFGNPRVLCGKEN